MNPIRIAALISLLACGGASDTASDSGLKTALADTGPCRGDLEGTITISPDIDCSQGCSGALLIGWFDTDPTSNPSQEPVDGLVIEGANLANGPVSYALPTLPCGDGFLATLLDVNEDFQPNSGDLIPLSGADAGVIRNDATSAVNQLLNFRLGQ